MTIICNVTGSERKKLAQVLSEITLWDSEYAGPPTFAYKVGNYTIDKAGTITCPDSLVPEMAKTLLSKLEEAGFTPKLEDELTLDATPEEPLENSPETAPEPAPEAGPETSGTTATEGEIMPDMADPAKEPTEPIATASSSNGEKLTISIPRDKLPDDALARLRTIIANKEPLFMRALAVDALPIEVTDDSVSFPWFTLTGLDGEAEAYSLFLTHLVKMATEQTRVLEKPYDGDNDRFTMRIFMVRLGMKGPQFALARKLMMQRLSGNSGWRYGAPPKKTEASSAPSPEEPTTPSSDTAPHGEEATNEE